MAERKFYINGAEVEYKAWREAIKNAGGLSRWDEFDCRMGDTSEDFQWAHFTSDVPKYDDPELKAALADTPVNAHTFRYVATSTDVDGSVWYDQIAQSTYTKYYIRQRPIEFGNHSFVKVAG